MSTDFIVIMLLESDTEPYLLNIIKLCSEDLFTLVENYMLILITPAQVHSHFMEHPEDQTLQRFFRQCNNSGSTYFFLKKNLSMQLHLLQLH